MRKTRDLLIEINKGISRERLQVVFQVSHLWKDRDGRGADKERLRM